MSAIPGTSAAAQPMSGSTNVQNEKAMLDKDGFLKMLVAQMTQQDPSTRRAAPQQPQQMASFRRGEQITNRGMNTPKPAASGMTGHDVAYTDPADPNKQAIKT